MGGLVVVAAVKWRLHVGAGVDQSAQRVDVFARDCEANPLLLVGRTHFAWRVAQRSQQRGRHRSIDQSARQSCAVKVV
jgi:hypothetical protein